MLARSAADKFVNSRALSVELTLTNFKAELANVLGTSVRVIKVLAMILPTKVG
jgi:hypothetical protein